MAFGGSESSSKLYLSLCALTLALTSATASFYRRLMGHNDPVTTNAGCDPEDWVHCKAPVSAESCKAMLRRQCQPKPSSWNKMQLYSIQKNGNNFAGVTAKVFTDYTGKSGAVTMRTLQNVLYHTVAVYQNITCTQASWENGPSMLTGAFVCILEFLALFPAEFLLTRGPYAILGYSWCGCSTLRHHTFCLDCAGKPS